MAVFRFLVNVDKCLDMSHYKCFFYKLKSQGNGTHGLFHVSEAQLGEGDSSSLRKAVADIRMYMDKYPYEVEDYRIIFAMRCPFNQAAQAWEQSVLYRLLRLRHEFLKAHISFSTAVEAERDNALNLVMLYDSDYAAGIPDLKSYFSSSRFTDDVKLLLQKYCIANQCCAISDLKSALEATRDGELYRDPHEADILLRYIAAYEAIDTALEKEDGRLTLLTSFIREQLRNYTVYEHFINNSDRREETLTLLRLTDFINHDTAPTDMGGHASVSTLAQRCDDAWEQVWQDTGAKVRYANMLARYKKKLEHAQRCLENPMLPIEAETDLPPIEPPGLEAISGTHGSFAEDGEEKKTRETVLKRLETYAKKHLFQPSFHQVWGQTYRQIIQVLADLKGSLQVYAQDLSDQYAQVLAERKRITATWSDTSYVADPKDTEPMRTVKEGKTALLSRLKEPSMNPSLSFQDVLNSEQKLEQANKNICFYLDCLSATTFANFLLLLIVCAGFFVLHYTLLQPYALTSIDTALYYLLYIAAAVGLMCTAFSLPYLYYSGRIRKCLQALCKDLHTYIGGYYDRAKYFSEYINHINCLDYLNRYHTLLNTALIRGHELKMGQLWHRDQVEKHLEMLTFFGGLIETATELPSEADISTVTVINNGSICDVIDCPVYWPQA